jgi:hypothetical protein
MPLDQRSERLAALGAAGREAANSRSCDSTGRWLGATIREVVRVVRSEDRF